MTSVETPRSRKPTWGALKVVSQKKPLLTLSGVSGGYRKSAIIDQINLSLDTGEFISLLGRNGMGKTTTVRAILGMAGWVRGSITLDGLQICGDPTHHISQSGIGLVAEGRHIFPNLTVTENLTAFAANPHHHSDPWTVDRVIALLPALGSRVGSMGGTLSGGEQQMLAIGRALMTNPKVLILDEATEGLAPAVRTLIWQVLRDLKAQGLAILAIDKHLEALGALSDRYAILQKGRIVWQGTPENLGEQPEVVAKYLGV